MERHVEAEPQAVAIDSIDQLIDVLASAGISTRGWGEGVAKSVDRLLGEIRAGEAALVRQANGDLLRKVPVVWVDVFGVDSKGRTWRLVEARREFANGIVHTRNLHQSLGEKMQTGETPPQAVERAIREELGIDGVSDIEQVGHNGNVAGTVTAYPGLESVFDMYEFKVMLPPEAYDPNGYVEVQPDKTTYFAWTLYDGAPDD